MAAGIYAIQQISTGRMYIGSSTNIAYRWNDHRLHLRKGNHINALLQKDWDMYGESDFTFRILDYVDLDELIVAEGQWKQTAKPYYNPSPVPKTFKNPVKLQNLTCKYCGKEYYRGPSLAGKYCSRKCFFEAQRAERAEGMEQRFWKYIPEYSTETDCWIWLGGHNGKETGAYGKLYVGRKKYIYAHRASYIIHYGEPSEGLDILHTCDNTMCVNPKHLVAGTHQENMNDKVRKAKQAKGTDYISSAFTEEDILFIRSQPNTWGIVQALAEEFGVANRTISAIRQGKAWRHVGGPTYKGNKPKWTEEQLEDIRNAPWPDVSDRNLAKKYGVSNTTISKIRSGKLYPKR